MLQLNADNKHLGLHYTALLCYGGFARPMRPFSRPGTESETIQQARHRDLIVWQPSHPAGYCWCSLDVNRIKVLDT